MKAEGGHQDFLSYFGCLNHVAHHLANAHLKTEFNLEKINAQPCCVKRGGGGVSLGFRNLGLESNQVRSSSCALSANPPPTSGQEEPEARMRTHLDSIVQYCSVKITLWAQLKSKQFCFIFIYVALASLELTL